MATGKQLSQHAPACLPACPTASDDPTILAWGLANEPRCPGDASCCIIPSWVDTTAAFLKGLDANHMVTAVSWVLYIDAFCCTVCPS